MCQVAFFILLAIALISSPTINAQLEPNAKQLEVLRLAPIEVSDFLAVPVSDYSDNSDSISRQRLSPVDLLNNRLAAYLQSPLFNDNNDDSGGNNYVTLQLPIDLKSRSLSDKIINDQNMHLHASGAPSLLSNDDQEMEIDALISQLTEELNLALPNTGNRSELIARLLASYLSARNENSNNNKQQAIDSSYQNQQHKDSNFVDNSSNNNNDNDKISDGDSQQARQAQSTFSREYIDNPLALVGHQLVQGGAGEGKQLLGPDGTFENAQVVKSDHALPSYCDPPNPCPDGYTAADGCLEDFVNSASFSREYQARKECSCDNEHSLFNCESTSSSTSSKVSAETENNVIDDDQSSSSVSSSMQENKFINDKHQKLNTLARTINNRFGGLAGIRNYYLDGKTPQVD